MPLKSFFATRGYIESEPCIRGCNLKKRLVDFFKSNGTFSYSNYEELNDIAAVAKEDKDGNIILGACFFMIDVGFSLICYVCNVKVAETTQRQGFGRRFFLDDVYAFV